MFYYEPHFRLQSSCTLLVYFCVVAYWKNTVCSFRLQYLKWPLGKNAVPRYGQSGTSTGSDDKHASETLDVAVN